MNPVIISHTVDGEKDEATIKYEFSTALEAVGLKPATIK